MDMIMRKGPWTPEEDSKLINFISVHGEGRWDSLACCAGLKRTGKSCRFRWLNYLSPNVRRGNITVEEQVLIFELHCRFGNRWSKIAQHLAGRTDNEIKNYWRTRVQKLAKESKCDVSSNEFKDNMRQIWLPRLMEQVALQQGSKSLTPYSGSNVNASDADGGTNNYQGVMIESDMVQTGTIIPIDTDLKSNIITHHATIHEISDYDFQNDLEYGVNPPHTCSCCGCGWLESGTGHTLGDFDGNMASSFCCGCLGCGIHTFGGL